MPVIADRYRLEKVIGRGGMGEVWLAEDTLLRRQVAAKRVGATNPSPEDLARALSEAKVTAMLDHEHVVRVYDLVEHRAEQWLVMEYVESATLAQLVRSRGRLDATTAARMIHQAAAALGAAHGNGVVHRDVKPSNLLVQSSGHVKLSDFGIARLEGDAGVTRTGQLIGSPAYLAPEVAAGRAATPASDLWSLGATAWYAVEGRPPYDAGEGNVVGTLYTIVNEPPPEAPHAGWLGTLIGRLMVPDPQQRWTAAEVTTYLSSALAVGDGARFAPERIAIPQRPVVPPPAAPTRTVRAPSPSGRRERSPVVLALGAAAIVVALIVALVGALVLGDRDRTPAAGGAPSASPSASSAAIERFVRAYLRTAPADPEQAFGMLTPGFQRSSGDLAGYERFWGTVAEAAPTRIRPDARKLAVSYDVTYRMDDGSRRTDSVVLRLAYADGKYRISGEG